MNLTKHQPLTSRRQWGLMPTWSFWNNPDNYQHVAPFMKRVVGASIGVSILVFSYVADGSLLWLAPIVSGIVPVLAMGGIERYIRIQVDRRRKLQGKTPTEALGVADLER